MAKSDSETQNDYDAAERGESKSTTERRRQTKGLRRPGAYKAASKEMMYDSWVNKPVVKGKKVKGVAVQELGVFALLTSPALGERFLEQRKKNVEYNRTWYAKNTEHVKEYNKTKRDKVKRAECTKAWRQRVKEENPEQYQKMLEQRRARHARDMADPEKKARIKERMRLAAKKYKASEKGKAVIRAADRRRRAAKKVEK